VYFGYPDEYTVSVPRLDEANYHFGDDNFIVIVPSGSMDTELLRIEIEKFNRLDVRFSIIEQEDRTTPGEILAGGVSLALALRDYLRTQTLNSGIEVIPHADYLTQIPLWNEGTVGIELERETYLCIPAMISLSEEGKTVEAGMRGDAGLLVPASGDAGIFGKLSGENLTVIVPERTENLQHINVLSALYTLLHIRYSVVEHRITYQSS
jgi:hypothetical protein